MKLEALHDELDKLTLALHDAKLNRYEKEGYTLEVVTMDKVEQFLFRAMEELAKYEHNKDRLKKVVPETNSGRTLFTNIRDLF